MGALRVGLLALWAAAAGADLRPVELRDLQDPKVESIRFAHLDATPIDDRELRAAMLTQEGERFQRHFFRGDLATIGNLYRSRGYLDVDILRRTLALDEAGRLRILLKIDSGSRWHVAAVAVDAGADTSLATALAAQLRVRPGDVFRYGQVQGDERELLGWLNSQGYAHARAGNRVDLDSRKRQATVTYAVTAGRRMYFGPVQVEEADLATRRSFVERQITFREGQLYNPEDVRRTRNNLARTGLFRSVTLTTTPPATGDSVQTVLLRLQERKFRRLSSRAFINNSEPGVSANVQHTNFLGRGNRIGADASLGQPLQGLSLFLMERNLLATSLDLTLSSGVTDEWGQTQVFADPADSAQFELLTANHSIANELNLLFGAEEAAAFISALVYEYPSVERLSQVKGVLGRRWEAGDGEVYQTQLTANWTQSRNRPIAGRTIRVLGGDEPGAAGSGDSPADEDGGFGDAPFDDNPFDEPPDSLGKAAGAAQSLFPYDDPQHPGIGVDATWEGLLTNRARTLNFAVDFQRDTRDNQIAPRRGSFLRAAALYAFEFGGTQTRAVDGDVEGRHYLQLSDHVVWAQAARAVATGSLRRESDLPQAYWKEFGGEGSVRGVGRNSIQAVGGGRGGLVLRTELRLRAGQAGAVLFWDRAGVWRHVRKARWGQMTDGYGGGLRWDFGIPFRVDLGFSEGFARRALYVSIGQAF